MTYKVVRFEPNAYNIDREGVRHSIVDRECPHRHRTLSGAAECRDKLMDYNRHTHMWSAAWHRAVIVHSDYSPLNDDESAQLPFPN